MESHITLLILTVTLAPLLITGAANFLGLKWSGLLSLFPVFACVMAIFAQRNGSSGAAERLLRGVIVGSIAFACFFVVVGLLVQRLSLVVAYTLATGVALAVNGFSLITLLRKSPVD
jgi:uncharacterized membrane protein